VDRLRCPSQAACCREHRDRPRARRLVMVAGGPEQLTARPH
jgi:hypothetical protein